MELHMPHTHLHESYIIVYLHTLNVPIMESKSTHIHSKIKICKHVDVDVMTTVSLFLCILSSWDLVLSGRNCSHALLQDESEKELGQGNGKGSNLRVCLRVWSAAFPLSEQWPFSVPGQASKHLSAAPFSLAGKLMCIINYVCDIINHHWVQ